MTATKTKILQKFLIEPLTTDLETKVSKAINDEKFLIDEKVRDDIIENIENIWVLPTLLGILQILGKMEQNHEITILANKLRNSINIWIDKNYT